MPARVLDGSSSPTLTKHGKKTNGGRIVMADIQLSSDLPQDVVALSEDVYEDIHGNASTGKNNKISQESSMIADDVQEHEYVSVKSVSGFPAETQQWVLFCSKLDKSLKPSTCLVGSSSHSSLVLSSSVLVRRTKPVDIEHTVLTFPSEIYDRAEREFRTGEGQVLEHLFSNRSYSIIRQGDYDPATGCKVRICEPVDQGILLRERTNITVVKREDTLPANTEALGDTGNHSNSNDEDTISDEDVDILISDFLSYGSSENDNNKNTTEPSPAVVECNVYPLSSPINLGSLIPRPEPAADTEAMGFVKVELLGRLGCFSGDTVLITTSSGDTRRIRLYSFPEPNTVSPNSLYLSPFLCYNLGSGWESAPVKVSKTNVEKSSSAIPTAAEVTISRLASPSTTDKTLQSCFLSGLRSYFEACHRVVKNGDIIAVPIDTILAQTLYAPGEDQSMDLSAGIIPSGKPNDVAWFQITSLVSTSDTIDDCVIDPSHTRMVQSGLVTGNSVKISLGWREYLSLPKLPTYGLNDDTPSGDFEHARKLKQLLNASLSPRGATLQTTILIHSSKRGTGKATLVKSVAGEMGIHCFEVDCYSIIGDNDAKTIGTLRARLDRAANIAPCIVLLRHIDAIAKKSEQDGGDGGGIVSNLVDVFNDYCNRESFILSATVGDVEKLSEAIRSKFKFEVVVPVPTESERKKMFSFLCKPPLQSTQLQRQSIPGSAFSIRSDVSIDNLALQSAGLTPPDLESIMEMSKLKAIARLEKTLKAQKDIDMNDLILGYGGLIKITPDDIEDAIAEARDKYSDSIGAPKIPNVGWDDVGGMDGVKKEILDTIEMPLKYPKLFSGGVKKRSGILFYGPPGTGKTLLAKAIATSFSLNFFSVKGPELLNMYIGESEANVRKVFQKARDAKPCVVFFDELDSVAPKRGNQGDSGGVMDRIVSQLLAELDGMSSAGGEGVFVVGATNRPDLLDEALLRPGRFDKMLYLGISDTHEKQRTILEALTRKFKLAPEVSLKEVSDRCPFTYTGADFYALSSDAMLKAMTRTAGSVDQKIKAYNEKRSHPISTRWWFQNVATKDDTEVFVTMEDFDRAQQELIPSVSADELRHYLEVRDNFEGGKDKAKANEQQPTASRESVEEIAKAAGIDPSEISSISRNGTSDDHVEHNGDTGKEEHHTQPSPAQANGSGNGNGKMNNNSKNAKGSKKRSKGKERATE